MEKELVLNSIQPYFENNMDRILKCREHKSVQAEEKTYLPGLTVIVLNLNHPELIIPLIQSLILTQTQFESLSIPFQIVIGDTGSTDNSVLDTYKKYAGNIQVVYDLKYHFSKNNNELFTGCVGTDRVLFMNNDLIFPAGDESILKMYHQMVGKNDVGIIGCRLFYPDGRIQHQGIDFFRVGDFDGLPFHPGHGTKADHSGQHGEKFFRAVSAVTGAFIMTRSVLFHRFDGFDEGYAAECQDVDFCLQVKREGYSIEIANALGIIHLENATRPLNEENWRDRSLFIRRWKSFIEGMRL